MEKITQFMEALDEKSKSIVWCIWRSRHANIRELSKSINAPTDSYTLSRLREVINPTAEQILGKPLLKFEEAKIDPFTGDKVLFSWWLVDGLPLMNKRDELLDIFDEPGYLRIVAQLSHLNTESSINVILEPSNHGYETLVISAYDYYRRVPLFYPVSKNMKKTYRNGILEIILKKRKGVITCLKGRKNRKSRSVLT